MNRRLRALAPEVLFCVHVAVLDSRIRAKANFTQSLLPGTTDLEGPVRSNGAFAVSSSDL